MLLRDTFPGPKYCLPGGISGHLLGNSGLGLFLEALRLARIKVAVRPKRKRDNTNDNITDRRIKSARASATGIQQNVLPRNRQFIAVIRDRAAHGLLHRGNRQGPRPLPNRLRLPD
jgi:hypothetical protein